MPSARAIAIRLAEEPRTSISSTVGRPRHALPSSRGRTRFSRAPCRSRILRPRESASLTTENPLPTIGRGIGNDAPPVFWNALRKTGGGSKLGKIAALLGSIDPVATISPEVAAGRTTWQASPIFVGTMSTWPRRGRPG
jgi:hypothetical protein